MKRKRVKAYLCAWCTGRRRPEIFSCTADLERHVAAVHANKVPQGTSTVEIRYRPVLIQGR